MPQHSSCVLCGQRVRVAKGEAVGGSLSSPREAIQVTPPEPLFTSPQQELAAEREFNPLPCSCHSGKARCCRWQWGQQMRFCDPHLLLWSLVWRAGVMGVGGCPKHGSPALCWPGSGCCSFRAVCHRYYPLASTADGEGVGSEPFMAALAMRVASCTCGEGKKQCRPSPRHPIYHQPK